MASEQNSITCCRLNPEAARVDPDVYTCATCPVEKEYAAMAADDFCLTVWRLWQRVATRFNFDGHGVGQAFERLTHDEDRETYDLLAQGISMLYDVLCPAHTEQAAE